MKTRIHRSNTVCSLAAVWVSLAAAAVTVQAEPQSEREDEVLHLSPSENHRHLMSGITPSLQYDGGDVETWQRELREKLRQLLGTVPEERCELRPPAAALQAMRRGLAALCIEQRAFGERREKKQQRRFPQICHDSAMHALMLGRTLTGERVFDVDRGINYLASRGDADMNLIGIIGNSGGGVISMYTAALLPRIAFSMPGCSFSRFEDSIMSIRHCPDNFIPGLFTVADMSDITGLIAPRPVVIVNGREDDLFPIQATREAFSEVERIYGAAGAKGRCHHVVGDGGHRFYADEKTGNE